MLSAPDRPRLPQRPSVIIVAFVILLAGCSGNSKVDDSAAKSTTTSPSVVMAPKAFATYLAAHPDAPLINVHIPYEGHIEGTDSFVAFDEIGDWDGLPADKDAPIIIYCRSGNMSATAAKTLASMGYLHIVDLEGGMNAWSAAGYDVLQDQAPPS